MSSPARADNWQDTFLRRWRIGKWCFNASGANYYMLSTISPEHGSEKKLGCIIQGCKEKKQPYLEDQPSLDIIYIV